MLRVLYKIGTPAENKRLLENGLKVPKSESGAQKVPPKPPAEAVLRSKRLATERSAAKKADATKVDSIRQKLTGEMTDEELAHNTYLSYTGRDHFAEESIEDHLAGLLKASEESEAEERAQAKTRAEDIAQFLAPQASETGDDVLDSLAEIRRHEHQSMAGEKSLDERVGRGDVIIGEDMEALVKGAEKLKLARTSEAYKPLLDAIPVNLPASERAHQLEVLRQDLKTKTEAAWRTLSALQEQLAKATGHEARTLEDRIITMRGQLDAMVEQEFFADHAEPQQAELFYKKDLVDRKRALLKNPEARRVFDKLNESRPDGGWGLGHYITPEMINDLDAGERDLGRAWHALEHDQLQLHSGTEVIKNERQARADVSKLQVDFIRHGKDFGVPSSTVEAFNLANVNRGDLERVADQVLADLGRYDVPQTARERFLSAGIAVAKGLGFDSFFGRKRANAKVNELQLMTDRYKELSTARAGIRGPQLVRGEAALGGFMIATDFGSSLRRGSDMSGVITSADRPGEREPALSLEQASDLQGILTEARHMATALERNRDSKTVRNSANELAAELQNRLLKYVDTPAARAKVYELANASLQNLERALSDQPSPEDDDEDLENVNAETPEAKTTKEAEVRWEPLEADLGVDFDTEGEIEELPNDVLEDGDEALGSNPDRMSSKQLERVDRATETLRSSKKGLEEALERGEPLGALFTTNLERFIQDREGTLHLLKLNQLDKNPAAQDLRDALEETKILIAEHRFLKVAPQAYRAIHRARADVRALGKELGAASSLLDNGRTAARLERLRGVVEQYRGTTVAESDAYDELQDAVRRFGEDLHGLNEEADLPAVGMGNERNKQFDEAISTLDTITAEMKSSHLRAKSKDEALISKQGSAYRRALITTGRMLGKTPASMQSTARFQEAQSALNGAENAYELWARRNGQRQVIDNKI